MNYQPWVEFFVALCGSVVGAYVAVRVTLARIEEKLKSHDDKLKEHGERLNRLEGVHFERGPR